MTLKEMEQELKSTKAKIAEMERRLRIAEDIEEIKKLQGTYVNLLMANKWDDIMDLFAENAIALVTSGTYKGKPAIEKWFKELVSKIHAGKEGDFVVHPIITVDGDKGKGSWLIYMMWTHPRTHQSLFWTRSNYECEYVRENGKWKFSIFGFKPGIGPGPAGSGPPDEKYLNNFLKNT